MGNHTATRARSRSSGSPSPRASGGRQTTLGREQSLAAARDAITQSPLPALEKPRANETAKGALARVARDEAHLRAWSEAHGAQLNEHYLDPYDGRPRSLTSAARAWRQASGPRADLIANERALYSEPKTLHMSADEHRATAAHFHQQAATARNAYWRTYYSGVAAQHEHAAEVKARSSSGTRPSSARRPRAQPAMETENTPLRTPTRLAATRTFADVFKERYGRAPATPQRVMAILNKAGFARATTEKNKRNGRYVTSGYSVGKASGDRRNIVQFKVPSTDATLSAEAHQQRVAAYAKALSVAGLLVDDRSATSGMVLVI